MVGDLRAGWLIDRPAGACCSRTQRSLYRLALVTPYGPGLVLQRCGPCWTHCYCRLVECHLPAEATFMDLEALTSSLSHPAWSGSGRPWSGASVDRRADTRGSAAPVRLFLRCRCGPAGQVYRAAAPSLHLHFLFSSLLGAHCPSLFAFFPCSGISFPVSTLST